jgi:hypothetical protein
MTTQKHDMVSEMEDLGRQGMGDIASYFTAPPSEGADNGARVDRALKMLSIYSRTRATRANEAAISVAIAKMAGIKGEMLHPLWEQLTGTPAVSLVGSERSDDEHGAVEQDQQDSDASETGKASARKDGYRGK